MITNPTPSPFTPTQVSTMQQYPTATSGLASQAPPQPALTPAQQAIMQRLQVGMNTNPNQRQAPPPDQSGQLQMNPYTGPTDLAGMPINTLASNPNVQRVTADMNAGNYGTPTGSDVTSQLTMPQMAIANLMGQNTGAGTPGSGYIGRGVGAPQPSPIAYGNRAPGPAPNVSYPTLVGQRQRATF